MGKEGQEGEGRGRRGKERGRRGKEREGEWKTVYSF